MCVFGVVECYMHIHPVRNSLNLHEEFLRGMRQRQSRAPRAVQYRDLYDPQSPADRIGDLQPLRIVHALVLHGNVLGHLAQALEKTIRFKIRE